MLDCDNYNDTQNLKNIINPEQKVHKYRNNNNIKHLWYVFGKQTTKNDMFVRK